MSKIYGLLQNRNHQLLLAISLFIALFAVFQLLSIGLKKKLTTEAYQEIVEFNKSIANHFITTMNISGFTYENPETEQIWQQICDELKLPNAGFICIIDSTSQLVAGPGLKPGNTMAFTPLLSGFDNKKAINPLQLDPDKEFEGLATFGRENRRDIVVAVPVENKYRLFVHQNLNLIQKKIDDKSSVIQKTGLLVSLVAGMLFYFSLRTITKRLEKDLATSNHLHDKKNNQYNELHNQFLILTNELESMLELSDKQESIILALNKDLNDSIRYAGKIQNATLSRGSIDLSLIPEHFIIFLPKNVVSGDFYWYHDFADYMVIAVADCTGHGVPGALMSMLGITFLNKIIFEEKVIDAAKILNEMRNDLIFTLDQHDKKETVVDSINISVCIIDKETRKMQFAGAYHSILCLRKGSIIELKGNRMPVGIYDKMKDSFTNQEFSLEKNDTLYLFSDGYADQFGGSSGRKFMLNNFRMLLLEVSDLDMVNQKHVLFETFKKWKGNHLQVDDVLVIGLKIG